MDHPIPKTNNFNSCQIVLTGGEIKKGNDIFIALFNSTYCVCPKGYYLAIISTIVETENYINEIKPAMDIIGDVLEVFDEVSDIYYPIDTSFKGNIYITSSYDHECHFENDINNVIEIYEKITGAKLDLNLEEEGEAKQ